MRRPPCLSRNSRRQERWKPLAHREERAEIRPARISNRSHRQMRAVRRRHELAGIPDPAIARKRRQITTAGLVPAGPRRLRVSPGHSGPAARAQSCLVLLPFAAAAKCLRAQPKTGYPAAIPDSATTSTRDPDLTHQHHGRSAPRRRVGRDQACLVPGPDRCVCHDPGTKGLVYCVKISNSPPRPGSYL